MKIFKAYFCKRLVVLMLVFISTLFYAHPSNAKTVRKSIRKSFAVSNYSKKKISIGLGKSSSGRPKLTPLKEKNNKSELAIRSLLNSGADIAHASKLPPRATSTTYASLKTDEENKNSSFGLSMTISKSSEVVMPESGGYSLHKTNFIFLPSYAITDNYSALLKLIAVHDASDSSMTHFNSGSIRVIKSAMELNNFISATSALGYGFPVNSKQRDIDSFLGSANANVNFAAKKGALGDLSLNVLIGYTKSFYKYTTELNLDPDADDTYNSDYSLIELVEAKYPLSDKFSFAFSLSNKQAWDYAANQKQSYDMTETLNWEINESFTLFGGLENEEAVKVSESSLNYRFYNSETSTYVMGITVGI